MLPALVLAGLLTGCSGNDCAELPDLRAERDAAREEYAELVRSGGATEEQTTRGDEAVHRLDRQVYELEQSCG